MANGGDPFTFIWLCSSAAAPNTTITNTKVIKNSIATPCPPLIPGLKDVFPNPDEPCIPDGDSTLINNRHIQCRHDKNVFNKKIPIKIQIFIVQGFRYL